MWLRGDRRGPIPLYIPRNQEFRAPKLLPPDAPLGCFKCRFFVCMPWPVFMYLRLGLASGRPVGWPIVQVSLRIPRHQGLWNRQTSAVGWIRDGLLYWQGKKKKTIKGRHSSSVFPAFSSSFLHHAGTFRLDLLLFIRFSPLGPVPLFFLFIHTPYLLACGTAEEHNIPFLVKAFASLRSNRIVRVLPAELYLRGETYRIVVLAIVAIDMCRSVLLVLLVLLMLLGP